MSMLKKGILFFVAMSLLASVGLSGCSKKTPENVQSSQPAQTTKAESQTTVQETKGEPVQIEFVHYQSGQQEVIQALADQYLEIANVKINQTVVDSKTAKQYLMTRAQEGKFPEIYGGSLDGETLLNCVKADLILDLTPEWEAWAYSKLGVEKSYKAYIAEGDKSGAAPGRYSIPYVVATAGYFYNAKLMKEVGVTSPPKTWDEFISLCEKLKAKNYAPLSFNFGQNYGAANTALFPFMTNVFGGEEETYKVMASSDCFKDPRWLKIFGALEELRDKKYFLSGTVTMTMPDCENKFINGEVAIIGNGSWFPPVLKKNGPDVEWVVAAPPAIVPENKVFIDGGVSTSFSISKKLKYTKEAIEFIKWFTDETQQIYLTEKAGVLPANSTALNNANIDDNTKYFSSLGANLTKRRAHELFTEAGIYEELWKGVQSLIEGKMNSQQLADELQKALESKKK